MEIVNGEVMEFSDFVTDAEIQEMNEQLSFMGSYKWNMGDVNTVIVPLQLVNKQTGRAYAGLPSKVAKQICIAEGMKEEEITKEYLFTRFMKQTEVRKVARFVRGYMVNTAQGKFTKRVLVEHLQDENGRYVKNIHDKISSLISPIHKKQREALEKELRSSGKVPEKVITKSLQDFDSDNKPIKNEQVRTAFEAIVIPMNPDDYSMQTDPQTYKKFVGTIFSVGKDTIEGITSHLHKNGEQTSLDYLEIKFSHPVINESSNPQVNKMRSGLKTKYEIYAKQELNPSHQIPEFDKLFQEYYEDIALSANALVSKIYDYQPITDNEALSYVKDYVVENIGNLTKEDLKKHEELLSLFKGVLSLEEIKKVSSVANTSSVPNETVSDNAPKDQIDEADFELA